MMGKNRIRVSILGSEYVILTEDPEQKIHEMASEVENQINSFIEASPGLSTSMATVLTALNFCDGKNKAENAADNLRIQITDYMQEAETSRDLVRQAKEVAQSSAEDTQKLREELLELRERFSADTERTRLATQQEIEDAQKETEKVRTEMVELRNRLVTETKAVVAQTQKEAEEVRSQILAVQEENERLKQKLSSEAKSEAEQIERLLGENSELNARKTALEQELETAKASGSEMEQILNEMQQQYKGLQRKISEETTGIQLKAKKEVEDARKALKTMEIEIETSRERENELQLRVEEAEREAAQMRLQLSGAPEPRTESRPAVAEPAAPPQGRYFSEDRPAEPASDSESSTDDLLSFFNLRQG